MTSNAMLAIQKAVFDTLNDDATLQALITDVFVHVPENTTYPYVVIGGGQTTTQSNVEYNTVLASFTVRVHARERSSKPVLDILKRIHQLLHKKNLTVAGHTVVYMLEVSSTIRQGAEGLSYTGENLFETQIQEIA